MKQFLRKNICGLLALLLLVLCTAGPVFALSASAFSDLPQDHWAYAFIDFCTQKGILNGYDMGNQTFVFKPENQVTKTEALKMVVETVQRAGIGYAASDCTAAWQPVLEEAHIAPWAHSYVAYALEHEFLTAAEAGTFLTPSGDTFADVSAVREECFLWLGRALWDRFHTSESSVFSLAYADRSEAAEASLPYLALLTNLGVLNGYEEDGALWLRPRQTITRAEFAKICSVAYQLQAQTIPESGKLFHQLGTVSQVSSGNVYPFSRFSSFLLTAPDGSARTIYLADKDAPIFYDTELSEDGFSLLVDGFPCLVSWGEAGELHIDFSMAKGSGRVTKVGSADPVTGYRAVTVLFDSGISATYYWNQSLRSGQTITFLADGVRLIEVQ